MGSSVTVYSHDSQRSGNIACVPAWSNNIRQLSDPSCCISYNIQPDVIDNRHIHAYVSKISCVSYLHIVDITHNKTLKINIFDDQEINVLTRRSFQNDSLQTCNVVCVYRDLIVVQIFCQNKIKFIVCSFNDTTNRMVYNRSYDNTNKLQLYECRFSPDESLMIIKQNEIYSRMYAMGSNPETVSIVICNWENSTCYELPCSTLDALVITSSFRVAMAFDPRTDTDLVVFSCSPDDDQRAVIGLYKAKKDIFLFTISIFQADIPALPGLCHNLQFLLDGSALILSITLPHLKRFATFVHSYWLDPDCYDKIGVLEYLSTFGNMQYMPLVSKSGRMALCGGRIYNIEDMTFRGTQSLMRMCRNVIVDCVLPENLNKLSLPKPIVQYLTL